MAKEPEKFGIRLLPPPEGGFALNEIPYDEPGASDPFVIGDALRRATYNYMHGVCLDRPAREWFGKKAPKPRLPLQAVSSWIRNTKREAR
jgi:hypothetical protein